MARVNQKARPHDKSVATMLAAVESIKIWPNKMPTKEVDRIVSENEDVSYTALWTARSIIKRKPELVDLVLEGRLSIYRAGEILTKGHRVICPTCEGKGLIYQ